MEKKSNEKGKLIVVAGVKGGIGKSMLTINIGAVLSEEGKKTCLLDGNFQFGNLYLMADLKPKYTIKDVIDRLESINKQTIGLYLSEHVKTGMYILPGPYKPEYAEIITPKKLEVIIDALLEINDFLVVDMESVLSDNAVYFLEKADYILLVTDLQIASLVNSKKLLTIIEGLGLNSKVDVVVNRVGLKNIMKIKEVENLLKDYTVHLIPNDFQIVFSAANRGIPFTLTKKRSKIAKAIIDMVAKITDVNKV